MLWAVGPRRRPGQAGPQGALWGASFGFCTSWLVTQGAHGISQASVSAPARWALHQGLLPSCPCPWLPWKASEGGRRSPCGPLCAEEPHNRPNTSVPSGKHCSGLSESGAAEESWRAECWQGSCGPLRRPGCGVESRPAGLGCRPASLPPCFKSTGEGWTQPASQGLLLTPHRAGLHASEGKTQFLEGIVFHILQLLAVTLQRKGGCCPHVLGTVRALPADSGVSDASGWGVGA